MALLRGKNKCAGPRLPSSATCARTLESARKREINSHQRRRHANKLEQVASHQKAGLLAAKSHKTSGGSERIVLCVAPTCAPEATWKDDRTKLNRRHQHWSAGKVDKLGPVALATESGVQLESQSCDINSIKAAALHCFRSLVLFSLISPPPPPASQPAI